MSKNIPNSPKPPPNDNDLETKLATESRRDFVKGLGLMGAAAAINLKSASAFAVETSTIVKAKNTPKKYPRNYQWTVVDEKGIREFPGWQLGRPELWAYTGEMSYLSGEKVDLRVSGNVSSFSLRIERDGHQPEVVYQQDNIKVIEQPTPEDAAVNGCNWDPTVWIPTDKWRSGVYLAYLSAKDANGASVTAEHFFVIKEKQAGSSSKLCMVLCTSTYTAYNDWGGANHYRSIKDGISTDVMEPVLSTQRPWAKGFVTLPKDAPDLVTPDTPGPDFKPDFPQVMWALENDHSRHYPDAGWATYESRFNRWAEKNGYVLEYITQHDLHRNPDLIKSYSGVVLVGHDEYWSWQMRDAIDEFVDEGGQVSRFGGNFILQIRLEDDGKKQVCYKYPGNDPVAGTKDKKYTTTLWGSDFDQRPGAQTLGLQATGYSRYGAANPRSSGGFTIYRPWHWTLENTGLFYGDVFGAAPINVLGFETDGLPYRIENGLPYPTGEGDPPAGLEIIAMAPATMGEVDRWNGEVLLNAPLSMMLSLPGSDNSQAIPMAEPGADLPARVFTSCMMAYFERGKGSVFNAGSCSWVRGLDMQDAFTEQITKNVLKRFGEL